MELNAQNQASAQKILVAYFSWSGNARALAGQIAAEIGGDLFEIKTVKTYPETYNECIAVARDEQNNNARPALSGGVIAMAQYGTVFLCYPNWWGTLPMGVFTFLESYDFSGKTMYPLITHGGSRFGRSLEDIKKLCPQALIGEGLSISAFDANPKDNTRVTAEQGGKFLASQTGNGAIGCFLCDVAAVSRDTDPNPFIRLLKNMGRNIKATGLYVLIGVVLSALFQRYVPEEVIAALFGSNNRGFGLLMAATIGVPLYMCGGGTIPLLSGWMQNGISMGSAAAFMVTAPATKITNLGALKMVMGFKQFLFYLAFTILFALASVFLMDYVLLR